MDSAIQRLNNRGQIFIINAASFEVLSGLEILAGQWTM